MTSSKVKRDYWIFTAIIAFVFVAWGINLWALIGNEYRGTFGDMFGTVNSIFSGLAFAGVIYAILLQRRELQLQRKELELTRNEFETQNKTLKLQRFENTFFQMLKLHGDIVNQMQFSFDQFTDAAKGRVCFEWLNKDLIEKWANYTQSQGSFTFEDAIATTYDIFHASHQAHIGHYFRNLYHILKLVDSAEVENKKKYSNIIRAQLSSYELVLLFYNCLSDKGKKKFKPLIEKYEFFENMDKDLLVDKALIGEYNENAFGDEI